MSPAIILLPCVPVRASASDRSEMTDQLLFGDKVEVLQQEERWSLVRSLADGYEGWVDNKQLTLLNAETMMEVEQWDAVVGTPTDTILLTRNEQSQPMTIPMGSHVPRESCQIAGMTLQGLHPTVLGNIVDTAKQLIGAPYLWGGKTLMGIDCSGFVQTVFRTQGLWLPRDAYQQEQKGIRVDNVQQCVAGDLLFFSNPEGRVIHVGIAMGNGRIIHASGQVRVEKIDSTGIFNFDEGQYTHRLCSIRRFMQ